MDAALLKQREAFLKRAAATPTVFKKDSRGDPAKRQLDDSARKSASKKARLAPAAEPTPKSSQSKRFAYMFHNVHICNVESTFDYKTAKASMVASFGNLARIVDHMKVRLFRRLFIWYLTVTPDKYAWIYF